MITGFPGLSRGRGEILQKVSRVYSGKSGEEVLRQKDSTELFRQMVGQKNKKVFRHFL